MELIQRAPADCRVLLGSFVAYQMPQPLAQCQPKAYSQAERFSKKYTLLCWLFRLLSLMSAASPGSCLIPRMPVSLLEFTSTHCSLH